MTAGAFSQISLNKITELLSGGFNNCKMLIIGDFMLDRYIIGSVSRISPEAPVPVLKYQKEKNVPGGAGNVAANLTGLGINCSLCGNIGKDEAGEKLHSLLVSDKTELDFILSASPTILKMRILGGGKQQMLRIDYEEPFVPAETELTAAEEATKQAAQSGARTVILSDYGKGFCSDSLCERVIAAASKYAAKVWVDPKKSDWQSYSGAFMITPNMKELSAAAGFAVPNEDAAAAAAGLELLSKFGIDNMLITRSEKGATLIEGTKITQLPVGAVEVFDVSGAGDTMIAAAAAFSASGLSLCDAARAANMASQIVIGKIGTCAIQAEELLSEFNKMTAEEPGKIVTAEQAAELCDKWKRAGEKVVFTNGCFDILHAGHAASLRAARALGDRLIVGLNSDSSVRRLKGPSRPVNSQQARAELLSALEAVDIVVVFDETTPASLLSRLRPQIIAKGGDYRPEEIAGAEYAEQVIILPFVEGYSTTAVIRRLSEQ